MFRKNSILTLLLLIPALSSHGLKARSVGMAPFLDAGNHHLLLNGSGVRTKYFLNIYVGGLYLNDPEHDPKKIMEADEAMAIRLKFISNRVTNKRLKDTFEGSFSRVTNGHTAPIRNKMDSFIYGFKGEIRENDVFDIIYLPGEGTEVFKNREFRSRVEGLDFKKIVFGIWLSDTPAHEGLKRGMLNRG